MGERTEKPTGRRLSKARQDGKVAKSQDLTAVVALATGLGVFLIMGERIVRGFAVLMRQALSGDLGGGSLEAASLHRAWRTAAEEGAGILLPVLLIVFLSAYLTQFLQVRWLLTTKPIRPKLSKLNPISGAKKLVSKRNAVKTLVSVLKLTLVVLVAWGVITARLDRLATIPRLAAAPAMLIVGKTLVELAFYLLFVLLLIAAADYIYQLWQHTEDLKMTKQEVKDERKMIEGDPKLKRERMRRYQKIVYQRLGEAVPQADVVINNPTHFSVAVRYDADEHDAPVVTAKGADHMAFRIRHLAARNNVPMVSRPPLARALYWGVEVGQPISPEHYEAVAEVLAYVYRIDTRARERANLRQPAMAGGE